MRLPAFDYLSPENLGDALELLSKHRGEAAILAGGTDLLVRMKQRLTKPAFLISLKGIKELNRIRHEEDATHIGAMTPLVRMLEDDELRVRYPALVKAVGLIGASGIQHFRGTIGGNLCLQTRCLYYNQSAFWRSGRTPCHKDKGETCYAEENSDRCRSANQSDGACALMALGATVIAASARGEHEMPIEAFFTGRGETPFDIEPDELVTEIRLPRPGKGVGSGFHKLTFRSAIDFALVSSSARVSLSGDRITEGRIAVGGAGAAPLLLSEAAERLKGKNPRDAGAIEETADQVMRHASAFTVHNLGATLEYRRRMLAVVTKRAIREAIEKALWRAED
ncbi:MAG: FAD binding domain-containing protein [Pseudomonadota bacterium]